MAKRAERIRLQWSIWYPRQASNLLEKSVANAARMPFLQEYFRPAYFIYIVRNGYAVAKGIRRKADLRRWRNPLYESRYPIELCAEQWLRSDEVVSSDSSRIERFLHIYYEDLVADPERVMRQITDFLDLEPLCSELSGRDWKVHGISAGIGNMNESSLAGLTREEVQGIREVAGERLHFHQYAEPSVSGRV